MANGPTTTASVDNAVREMLAASRYTMEHAVVMANLPRKERIPGKQGSDYNEPKYGALADAQDLVQGTDIAQSQKIQDDLLTLTPTEVGHLVTLTERVVDTVRDDQFKNAGKLMGEALARRVDKDGLTQLDNFSLALGTAGTALTWEHIGAARTAIRGGGGGAAALFEPAPASSPIYGVFHPHQLWIMLKDLAPAGTYPIPTGLSERTQLNGEVPSKVAGVQLFEAGNLTIDASDDAKGGVFSKEALILVMDQPDMKPPQYFSRSRAWEIVQVCWYIYGEYKDQWGREMLFDAVMPVS